MFDKEEGRCWTQHASPNNTPLARHEAAPLELLPVGGAAATRAHAAGRVVSAIAVTTYYSYGYGDWFFFARSFFCPYHHHSANSGNRDSSLQHEHQ